MQATLRVGVRRAGSSVGSRPEKGMTAAVNAGCLPWGGAKAERSPNDRSAAPGGSISPASSGQPVRADASHGRAHSDGLAPPSKIARAWGPPRQIAGAGRPMPFAQAFTTKQENDSR